MIPSRFDAALRDVSTRILDRGGFYTPRDLEAAVAAHSDDEVEANVLREWLKMRLR